MTVVAPVEHPPPSIDRVDVEDEGLAPDIESLPGLRLGEGRRGPRDGDALAFPVPATHEDAVLPGRAVGEEVEVVVDQAHLVRGLILGHGLQGERLAPDQSPSPGRAGEVRHRRARQVAVAPLVLARDRDPPVTGPGPVPQPP